MAMWASWPSPVTTRFNPSAKALVLPPGNPRNTTTPPALLVSAIRRESEACGIDRLAKTMNIGPSPIGARVLAAASGQQPRRSRPRRPDPWGGWRIDRGDGRQALRAQILGLAAVRLALPATASSKGLGIGGGFAGPVLVSP